MNAPTTPIPHHLDAAANRLANSTFIQYGALELHAHVFKNHPSPPLCVTSPKRCLITSGPACSPCPATWPSARPKNPTPQQHLHSVKRLKTSLSVEQRIVASMSRGLEVVLKIKKLGSVASYLHRHQTRVASSEEAAMQRQVHDYLKEIEAVSGKGSFISPPLLGSFYVFWEWRTRAPPISDTL